MIPRRLLDNYTAAINRISNAAQDGIRRDTEDIDLSDIAKARNEIITIMDAYLEAATDAAASLSAAFYDACRQVELGEKIGAYAESERDSEDTHEAVRAFMQIVVDGGTREQVVERLCERADYEVKVAANEAVMYCGERDFIG